MALSVVLAKLQRVWCSPSPKILAPSSSLPHPFLIPPSYPHSFLFLSILPSYFPLFPSSLSPSLLQLSSFSLSSSHFTALVILGLILICSTYFQYYLFPPTTTNSYPFLPIPLPLLALPYPRSSLPSSNPLVYIHPIHSIHSIHPHHPSLPPSLPPLSFDHRSPLLLREIVLGPSTFRIVQAQWQPGWRPC